MPERGVIAWMACNPIAANLLMILVMLSGFIALDGIPKETFPRFPSETLTVTVPYPGSSAEEVEEGIVIKIEEEILGIDGIDEISSVSQDGMGLITVQLKPGVSMAKVLSEVKVRVDGISEFPLNAEPPIIAEVLSANRAMQLSLYGALSERQLKELAEEMRDEILLLPEITQVSIRGGRDYEISIEVSDQGLRRYGLHFDDIVAAVRNQSRDLPGGKLRTTQGVISLRSVGQAYTGEEFSELIVVSKQDGTRVTLADVATIRDGFEEQPVLSRLNSKPSITLYVEQVRSQNILNITDRLQKYADVKREQLPPGVELTTWMDASQILRGRLSLLLKSAAQGALLVIITLALFLDLSLAFWVVIGIPFSILGTLLSINMLGIDVSINVLSAFAFILVLGILVDDGIVTAESAFAQIEADGPGVQSVIRGVKRVAVPTVFGVFTTIIAFMPMLFLTEGFARALGQIAPIVIFCLIFSLIETKLILPAHLRHTVAKRGKNHENKLLRGIHGVQQRFAGGLKTFAETRYQNTLRLAIKERYTTLAIFLAVLILVLALLPAGILRFVFFPNAPSDLIRINLVMPPGTAYQTTHDYALRIEGAAVTMNDRYKVEAADDTDVIEELMTLSTTDNEATITIELLDSTKRNITSVEMAGWLREGIGELAGIQSLSIDAVAGPSAVPVDVELSGRSLDNLRRVANEVKTALAGFTGVSDIRDTFNSGAPELDIRITREGESLGLGQVELARQVRQAFFGAEIQRVQRGRNEVRVYVRFPKHRRASLDSLNSMWIRLPDGNKVPFAVVGEVHERTGLSTINHFNRQRVVNVQADVNKSLVEPNEVNKTLRNEILPRIIEKYPDVSFRFRGEAEAQEETSNTLFLGVVVVLIMIYAALAIPLQSYSQPVLIMSAIPFGIVGALLGHYMLGKPVNVLSVVGMVGLIGIVVNDSLVLVDYINHRIAEGAHWREAVVQAGVRRFRAVILTSVTTFMGLLPIQLETSLQAQFVKPMAISVAFGVLFATVVTLFLVPILFFVAKDLKILLRGADESTRLGPT